MFGGDDPEAAVKTVHERVAEMTDKLSRRADQEIDSLPFTSYVLSLAALREIWAPLFVMIPQWDRELPEPAAALPILPHSDSQSHTSGPSRTALCCQLIHSKANHKVSRK